MLVSPSSVSLCGNDSPAHEEMLPIAPALETDDIKSCWLVMLSCCLRPPMEGGESTDTLWGRLEDQATLGLVLMEVV